MRNRPGFSLQYPFRDDRRKRCRAPRRAYTSLGWHGLPRHARRMRTPIYQGPLAWPGSVRWQPRGAADRLRERPEAAKLCRIFIARCPGAIGCEQPIRARFSPDFLYFRAAGALFAGGLCLTCIALRIWTTGNPTVETMPCRPKVRHAKGQQTEVGRFAPKRSRSDGWPR